MHQLNSVLQCSTSCIDNFDSKHLCVIILVQVMTKVGYIWQRFFEAFVQLLSIVNYELQLFKACISVDSMLQMWRG